MVLSVLSPRLPLLCICVLLGRRNVTSFDEQQCIPSHNLYGVSLVQICYQDEVCKTSEC